MGINGRGDKLTILVEGDKLAARLGYRVWKDPRLWDGLLFLTALAVYGATTAPGLLPADSGEFQLVAARLGVAHPPGYPLYTLVGFAFIHLLPLGSPAYRLNLLSALLAAGTLVLVSAAVRRWSEKGEGPTTAGCLGGLVAALALGTAPTFWTQATIANIRMPTLFLAALGFYALARFTQAHRRAQADRALLLLAVALGTGLAHHASLAFVALFWLLYLLLVDPRLVRQPRRWWRPALVGLAGLLPLAYLPIRGAMGAPLAPPNLHTWRGFLFHVTAQGFGGDMFAFANAQDLPHRLALVPTLFRLQFHPGLLLVAILGGLWLLGRDRRLFLLLAGGWALHTFVAITYRAPQTVEYLMPAYLPVAIAIGLLTAAVASPRSAPRPAPRTTHPVARLSLAALLTVSLLAPIPRRASSFLTLRRDGERGSYRALERQVTALLEQAPPGSLILADWRWATPLWYLQQVDGRRPDVTVRYVYPVAGQPYRARWRTLLDEAVGQRPVLLTHFYDFEGYTMAPRPGGFRAYRRPLFSDADGAWRPPDLVPREVRFGQTLRLLGYRLSPTRLTPGGVLEVTLAWQPLTDLSADGGGGSGPSFTVRLVGAGGKRVAQADRYLGSGYTPGEVRFERLVLPLYPWLSGGAYTLRVGAYVRQGGRFVDLPTETGETLARLAEVPLASRREPPLSLHPLSVPFAGGPTLVGVDYDRSPLGGLGVYLHWRGPARGGEVVRLEGGGGERAEARLPALEAGRYQTLFLTLPGETIGPLRLSLVDPEGKWLRTAPPWRFGQERVGLPAPSPTARFVPLGDAMALVGVAARGEPRPGEPFVLDLTFVALRPLVEDYATSVRLTDGEGRWLAVHDSQPALGAIPTLKWIRGSRVVDRHRLTVPADFAGSVVEATLVAYERFDDLSLPPMQPGLEAVPLGRWSGG